MDTGKTTSPIRCPFGRLAGRLGGEVLAWLFSS